MRTHSASAEPAPRTMPADFDPWLSGATAADVAAASFADAEGLARRRASRLAELIESAARDSAFYRRRWAGVRTAHARLEDLPVVHKGELMRHFNRWVTDPALRLHDLRRFVADPACVAQPYLGRYIVWQSSGSGGEPGLFVQDARSLAVYDALEALRRPAVPPWRLLDPFFMTERIAFVGAIGGHFASTVTVLRVLRINPVFGGHLRQFSFLQPIDDLLRELRAWQPTIIATYPSQALALAEARRAGRLGHNVREVWTGGETLTPATRRFVQQAFACAVIDSYGASEFLSIASECSLGQLHLNSDWVVLEPVDAQGRAVPPGQFGSTTLLTNLANRVQPLIRYDLGDRVAISPQRCACGSQRPVVWVQGRGDDCLLLRRADGQRVRVLPLALATVLEEQAGLFDFQLCQLDAREVQLGTGMSGDPAEAALRRARAVLAAFLATQGAGDVEIRCVSGLALQQGRSGKLPRVISRMHGARSRTRTDTPCGEGF